MLELLKTLKKYDRKTFFANCGSMMKSGLIYLKYNISTIKEFFP